MIQRHAVHHRSNIILPDQLVSASGVLKVSVHSTSPRMMPKNDPSERLPQPSHCNRLRSMTPSGCKLCGTAPSSTMLRPCTNNASIDSSTTDLTEPAARFYSCWDFRGIFSNFPRRRRLFVSPSNDTPASLNSSVILMGPADDSAPRSSGAGSSAYSCANNSVRISLAL